MMITCNLLRAWWWCRLSSKKDWKPSTSGLFLWKAPVDPAPPAVNNNNNKLLRRRRTSPWRTMCTRRSASRMSTSRSVSSCYAHSTSEKRIENCSSSTMSMKISKSKRIFKIMTNWRPWLTCRCRRSRSSRRTAAGSKSTYTNPPWKAANLLKVSRCIPNNNSKWICSILSLGRVNPGSHSQMKVLTIKVW